MIVEEKKNDPKGSEDINKAFKRYIKTIENSRSITVENGQLTFSDFLQNKMLIIHSIRQGFSYALFEKIKQVTPFTEEDWAGYLNLSTKTLYRYSNDKNFRFKPIHTEKIIELAEVTNFGKEVFDSTEQFYTWLNTASYALGNLKPAELLKDSYGKELVMGELNRIEQGIFV